MSIFIIILLSIIGLIALISLWTMGTYNNLIRLKALLNEGWSGIDVQLKRRYDLIPNLVSIVKGYSIHEKEIVEKIVTMRAASMGATGVTEKAQAEAGLTKALKSLFALSENYPDLKANENFLALQNQLSMVENELQLARRYYNGTTRSYNVATERFPSRIVAQFFNFANAPFFELSTPEEKETPKIQF